MSGNTGKVVATYCRSGHLGHSNTDITGSNGQVFSLKRPFWQWGFQWELYGGSSSGGRQGTLLYTATSPGGVFSSKPDYFLQDMQGGAHSVEMRKLSYWPPTKLAFSFNDRRYVWRKSWKGFRLNAVDEDKLDKNTRIVFAKFKMHRDIIIYEAGMNIPPQIIILTGFIVKHVYRQVHRQQHANAAGISGAAAGTMSGNTGKVVAKYWHTGNSDTEIEGDDRRLFFLRRPNWQWSRDWELFGGGRDGLLLYTATIQGGRFTSMPEFFLQDMQGGPMSIEMKKTGGRNCTDLGFLFNGRTYVWTRSYQGFRLNAIDEEGIDRRFRTIFAKFKTYFEIRIYEAAVHIPHHVIILTGFIASYLYDRDRASNS